jgi:DNA-binding beta-propeller fold protein YncE
MKLDSLDSVFGLWIMNPRRRLCGLLLVLSLGLCARSLAVVTAPRFVLTWGSKGVGPGEFRSPIGIAINRRDVIFITEFNNSRVQKFDTRGKYLGQFPCVNNPGGIAVDEHEAVYVTSMLSPEIHVYDLNGMPLRKWGKPGKSDGEFNQPGGLALGPDGALYVADQGNHRVQRFTLDGRFLSAWGGHGKEPGRFGGGDKPGSRFGGPHFLAFNTRGNLYTTESHDGRIQRLTADGRPLAAWGGNGKGPGGFGGREKPTRTPLPGPIGVLVDCRGRAWVSATNSRVQLFTPEGKFLLSLNELEGDAPGQFHLPHAMAMDSKGFIYIVDASNQRIQKFAP